jgi:hypothetical protein
MAATYTAKIQIIRKTYVVLPAGKTLHVRTNTTVAVNAGEQ